MFPYVSIFVLSTVATAALLLLAARLLRSVRALSWLFDAGPLVLGAPCLVLIPAAGSTRCAIAVTFLGVLGGVWVARRVIGRSLTPARDA